MTDNIDKWIKYLDPENLKGKLMFASLYIASFESLKDFIIDNLQCFYSKGLNDHGYKLGDEYNEVKKLHKKLDKASLLWFKEHNAIEASDIDLYDELGAYRNKLAHELMDLLNEDLLELPTKLVELISLRIKIEKWWIWEIEIPINPDLDNLDKLTIDDITT